MAAPTREEKSCAYCGSKDISAGRLAGLKLGLTKLTTMWAAPNEPEIVVRPKNRVTCASCGMVYVVQTIGNEETRELLQAIAVQPTALASFQSIFPGRGWDELEDSVTVAVRPVPVAAQLGGDVLRIFLTLDGKRAYLACRRVAGRFAAAAVEEAAG